jgi:hypothetical protein
MIADFNKKIASLCFCLPYCLRWQIANLYHLPIHLNPFYIFPPTRLYLGSSIHKIHIVPLEPQGFSH